MARAAAGLTLNDGATSPALRRLPTAVAGSGGEQQQRPDERLRGVVLPRAMHGQLAAKMAARKFWPKPLVHEPVVTSDLSQNGYGFEELYDSRD